MSLSRYGLVQEFVGQYRWTDHSEQFLPGPRCLPLPNCRALSRSHSHPLPIHSMAACMIFSERIKSITTFLKTLQHHLIKLPWPISDWILTRSNDFPSHSLHTRPTGLLATHPSLTLRPFLSQSPFSGWSLSLEGFSLCSEW